MAARAARAALTERDSPHSVLLPLDEERVAELGDAFLQDWWAFRDWREAHLRYVAAATGIELEQLFRQPVNCRAAAARRAGAAAGRATASVARVEPLIACWKLLVESRRARRRPRKASSVRFRHAERQRSKKHVEKAVELSREKNLRKALQYRLRMMRCGLL